MPATTITSTGANDPPMSPHTRAWHILATVTLGGFLSLAVELSLARLVRPWFGDMLFVWAAIIGFVLLYMAVGNLVGGRISPRAGVGTMAWLVALAGVGIYLLPWLSRPALYLAQQGMQRYDLTLPAAALLVIFTLVAWPLTLLGMLSPIAVHLLTREGGRSGPVSGRVFALSTLGSLAGAFVPVFFLLPTLGTRRTFALLGLVALGWAATLWAWSRKARHAALALALLMGGMVHTATQPPLPLKGVPSDGRGRVVYEEESAYNFIQVVAWQEERWLRLNEGEGIHSVWRPGPGLSEGIWDYFLLAPYFGTGAWEQRERRSLLVIGLAGGTIPTLYARAFGPVEMVGVELDPAIVRVAYLYFGLEDLPTLKAVAEDGRVYLRQTNRHFDVIAVDAYRPPYIPFHLATVEFFTLVREHLASDGVVAVNVARTAEDDRLVRAISSTMQQVFPSVFIVDEPLRGAAWGNSLVVGTSQPVTVNTVWHNLEQSTNPYVQEMARRARGYLRPAPPPSLVLQDDHAPVEQLVHAIMLGYLLGR